MYCLRALNRCPLNGRRTGHFSVNTTRPRRRYALVLPMGSGLAYTEGRNFPLGHIRYRLVKAFDHRPNYGLNMHANCLRRSISCDITDRRHLAVLLPARSLRSSVSTINPKAPSNQSSRHRHVAKLPNFHC